MINHITRHAITRVLFLSLLICVDNIYAQDYPISDLGNTGNWVLNQSMSDEFEAASIDEDKWLIQGRGGVYQSNFIGRAPSQFSTENAILENGKLKILTKWEPSYAFTNDANGNMLGYYNGEVLNDSGVKVNIDESKPITTAAVISKQQFQYGYMEIKSKAANAEVTSSFWTTGPGGSNGASELDMFEMFGGHKSNIAWRKRLKFNMISWDPNNSIKQAATAAGQSVGTTHTRNIQAANNTAGDFHVYGFDWTADYIKVYIDGVLTSTIEKSVITNNGTEPDRWVTDVPYWVWFDSETFPWLGLPDAADLVTPAEYQIEYIRVWQTNTAPITPTQLTAGDIGIVGWKAEGTNNGAVAFMLLKDINIGTSLSISNRSWKADGSFNLGASNVPFAVDDVFSWTATNSHSAGTIFKLDSNGIITTIIAGVETAVGTTIQTFGTDNDFDLSDNGDAVLIYNGATETHPVTNSNTWITGINTNDGWGSGGGNAYCVLPAALTNGTNAVSVGTDQDNGVYKGELIGSTSSLLANINNSTKWITDEAINYNLWSHLENVGINPGDIGIAGTLSVSNYEQKNNILIYPNPVNKSISQYINIDAPFAKQIILYDLTGKQLLKQNKTTEILQIPVSNIAPGMYILSIISGANIETKKVIIK